MPKEPNNTRSTEGKQKTSLYIPLEQLKALKYIEFKDDKTRTDIIEEALSDYISKWEKKNGSIPGK